MHQGSRVYRYFTSPGATKFQGLAQSGLLDQLTSHGTVIGVKEVSDDALPALKQVATSAALFVEHPRVPFISYCYEWPFPMLKAAALAYLDVLLTALEKGYILKDATPYNVQFRGPNPLFIDLASFEPYEEGQPWMAYNEFCRLFLNPLLLQALTGVGFHRWLRGSLAGIEPGDLSRLLSWRHKLRPGVFTHVVVQGWLESKFASSVDSEQRLERPRISKETVVKLVTGLKKTIAGLESPKAASSWSRYDAGQSYSEEARSAKASFVESELKTWTPNVVWDLGCNTGEYSLMAAKHAKYVVAMDGDCGAVGALYRRAKEAHSNVLPLVIDFLDPSPRRGWAEVERQGIVERGPADAVLALALVHHLAIAGNVPLTQIMAWLARIAQAGIVEFVPKADPALQRLLRWRPDVYGDYSKTSFEEALGEHFQVVKECPLPGSARVLYSFIKR